MSIVVSDTSPLRALDHLRRLDLLRSLFGRVIVPPAVVRELTDPNAEVTPVHVDRFDWIEVRAPVNAARVRELGDRLGAGEAEAICVATEVPVRAILMDELLGRTVAAEFGLEPIGTLGVLLRAKPRGLVKAVGPLLAQLESGIDFRISDELRTEVLKRAGEQRS